MDAVRPGSKAGTSVQSASGGMQGRSMARPGVVQWNSVRIGVLAAVGLALGLLCWSEMRPRRVETPPSARQTGLQSSTAPHPVGVAVTEGPARSFVKRSGTDSLRHEVIAWVRREHPDVQQYADYLAETVCLLDRMLAPESRTHAEIAEILSLYQRWVRAADANADGSIFDNESGLASAQQYLAADECPQVRALLDANRDGTISDEEWARVSPERLKARLLGSVAERQKLLRWDTNDDGVLSVDERAAGDAQLASSMIVQPDGSVRNRRSDEESQSIDDQARVLADVAATRGLAAARDASDALESLKVVMLSREYIGAAGIGEILVLAEKLGAVVRNNGGTTTGEIPRSALVETSPDVAQIHRRVFERARELGMAEPVARTLERGQDPRRGPARWAGKIENIAVGGYYMLSSRYDASGSGKVSEAEWETGLSDTMARNDAAVMRLYYDTDGDGVLGSKDLLRYMEWLGSHSPRADVNEDGRVDHQDLQEFLDHYNR